MTVAREHSSSVVGGVNGVVCLGVFCVCCSVVTDVFAMSAVCLVLVCDFSVRMVRGVLRVVCEVWVKVTPGANETRLLACACVLPSISGWCHGGVVYS